MHYYLVYLIAVLSIYFINIIFIISYYFLMLKILSIIIPVLLTVAFFTVMERKTLGSIQRRKGPSIVGIWGSAQAFADAGKLLSKETIIPGSSNFIIFILSPIITFILSLLLWAVIPFGHVLFSNVNISVLFIFAISSLSVHGIVMSGWSSNSKYAFLGALRATAQMIAYEVTLIITVMPVFILATSLNLNEIVYAQRYMWFVIPLLPAFIMFFIVALAETNRSPFDLPEAESELVSGYNVEYSSISFALFFLAEYSNILLMSTLIVLFFFGGWLPPFYYYCTFLKPNYLWFLLKFFFINHLFISMRGILPRFRYDQLMFIGWKILLPCSFGYFLFIIIICKFLLII